MNFKRIIIFISVINCILLLGCERQKYYKEEYEDGSVKFIVPVKDNLYHGKMQYYFPDGAEEGFSTWYYGKQNGYAELLHKNGKVRQKLIYDMGKRADSAVLYREDGSLQEIQYYDSLERVFDYKKFTRDNVQDTAESTRMVMIVSESDTISLSETFTAYLRIGNRQGQAVEAVLGNYHEDSLLYARKPRLKKIDNFTVKIEKKPIEPGKNFVRGVAIEVFDEPKSISLYPFEYEFYVKPLENAS
ncbi:toxin-antitoxin system YwqK family antitoxin [Tunicatimonas pelagia]|uniref:toxin-antitoxin system YwqK family antitoxin n=1 Tax=Tunicatimonas pelagia TaxID=931531 RepID=UPI00266695D6|nr:hypothetical protein [Tunicatimonas pelagia]WKN43940.1 hypothetical protein P0M28_03010 [Tunicatimonas pelagia]